MTNDKIRSLLRENTFFPEITKLESRLVAATIYHTTAGTKSERKAAVLSRSAEVISGKIDGEEEEEEEIHSCKKCGECEVGQDSGLCETCQREEDTIIAIDSLEADLRAAAEKHGYSVKPLWIAGTRTRQFELFLDLTEGCDCFTVRISDRRAVSHGQDYSILTDASKAEGFEFSLAHVENRMARNAAKKQEIGETT